MSTPFVIVTGAAGFIGFHTCRALLAAGTPVLGIDNFDPFYAESLKQRNIADLQKFAAERSGTFDFVRLDLAESSQGATAFEQVFAQGKPRGVIHLAGKAGVRPSIADPSGYVRANVLATQAVLDAVRRHEIPRLLIASSSSVYGNNRKTPFAEDDPVDHPISPYAATKKACELLAHTHWSLTRLPVACLRFFTVFGPRQRPDLAISLFMRRMAAGEPIEVFGDGSMRRDFTYVDDIVTGILAAYEAIPTHGYRVWNLGSDRPIELSRMVDSIARVTGVTPKIVRKPMQPGDVDATWADLTRARAELRYAPSTDFEAGLARQWAWMREVAVGA